MSESITVRRLPLTLRPNSSRVLLRPFFPDDHRGTDAKPVDSARARLILSRILALSEEHVSALLEQVFKEFGDRHQRVSDILAQRFLQVRQHLPADVEVSEARQLLIGSYFTSEYSLESAAHFSTRASFRIQIRSTSLRKRAGDSESSGDRRRPYLLDHFSLWVAG